MDIRWWGLGLGIVQAVGLALPVWSAETITFSLGPLERSLPLTDLETFARDGTLSPDLQSYAGYFNVTEAELETYRQFLNQPANLDVVTVDRFLYTRQGEYLLNIAADVIRTAGRRQDYRALRGPLIVAAADSTEGLTLLNVLRNFPTPTVRVDLAKGLAIAREIDRTVYQTGLTVDLIAQRSAQDKTAQPLPSEDLAAIAQAVGPGPYGVERVTLLRTPLPANIYAPLDAAGNALLQRPAVVISHGLGSDRTAYAYLGRHLASHGFVAISVEHPGSSAEQIGALLTGRSSEVVPDSEFIQRPEQISALLDNLLAQAVWRERIDFDRIGVVGQSFGGYTALALAGAPVDFAALGAACPPAAVSLNVSLLLQCQALALAGEGMRMDPAVPLDLSDERITAAIAINPISSVLFGQTSFSQIDVPTMIVSGGADTVAPALSEQIVPFSWLTMPERYLVVMPVGTHFSTIALSETGSEAFILPPELIGLRPDIAQTYVAAISLAFMENYLTGDRRYQSLLTSAGVSTLSDLLSTGDIPLGLLQDLPPDILRASRRRPPDVVNEAVNDAIDVDLAVPGVRPSQPTPRLDAVPDAPR